MRFAELVNHRIFERKWRSRVILRACLFECPFLNGTVFHQIIFAVFHHVFICVGTWQLLGASVAAMRGHLKNSASKEHLKNHFSYQECIYVYLCIS